MGSAVDVVDDVVFSDVGVTFVFVVVGADYGDTRAFSLARACAAVTLVSGQRLTTTS